jgi:hypothetical protein
MSQQLPVTMIEVSLTHLDSIAAIANTPQAPSRIYPVLYGKAIAEEQEVDTGSQDKDEDLHLGVCKNLHGHMKSFDHGSVRVPWQTQRELQKDGRVDLGVFKTFFIKSKGRKHPKINKNKAQISASA